MKLPSLADEDDLMRMTRRVLGDFAAETRSRGYAISQVVYSAGDGEWSFPLDFDEFLAIGLDILCTDRPQRTWNIHSIGKGFILLGVNLALTYREQPGQLVSERLNWESTLFGLLRTRGPRAVVITEHFVLWPSGVGPCPVEPPVIVVLGFHAARIVGYVCTHRAGEVRGMSFGLPVALSTRLARALGERKYLKIFGPGRM